MRPRANRGAKLSHQRRIPDELDSIAQNPVAAQQNCPAADLAAALPHRLSKVVPGGFSCCFGTPRVRRGASRRRTDPRQQRHAFMVTRGCVVGAQDLMRRETARWLPHDGSARPALFPAMRYASAVPAWRSKVSAHASASASWGRQVQGMDHSTIATGQRRDRIRCRARRHRCFIQIAELAQRIAQNRCAPLRWPGRFPLRPAASWRWR